MIIPIGTAFENNKALPITLSMRAYFSSYHLWTAKNFAKQAKIIENLHSGKPKFDIRHRAFVTSSILSSIAFAEAAINEVFQDAVDKHHSYISSLDKKHIEALANSWEETELKNKSRTTMLDKYQLALICCDKEVFDKSCNPYQNAKNVIHLRNLLVHYKPESISVNDNHKLSNQLRGKFSENKLMLDSGNPYFPDKCLGYGCAKWSWTAMENLVNIFYDKINVVPNYQKVNFE